ADKRCALARGHPEEPPLPSPEARPRCGGSRALVGEDRGRGGVRGQGGQPRNVRSEDHAMTILVTRGRRHMRGARSIHGSRGAAAMAWRSLQASRAVSTRPTTGRGFTLVELMIV